MDDIKNEKCILKILINEYAVYSLNIVQKKYNPKDNLLISMKKFWRSEIIEPMKEEIEKAKDIKELEPVFISGCQHNFFCNIFPYEEYNINKINKKKKMLINKLIMEDKLFLDEEKEKKEEKE